MPTTVIVDHTSTLFNLGQLEYGNKRIEQYQKGINTLLELNKNNNIDMILADNGSDFDLILDKRITVINNNPNNYGKINKGAGLIEIWRNNIELLKKYDYIIHFEPRQLLINNDFIDDFMKNPRNLFTIGKEQNHFNTGLFCIKSSTLLQYIQLNSPQLLVSKRLGIEYSLYHFFLRNKIQFDTRKKMNLIWYDTAKGIEISN
jgi:hypothetical protein